MSRSERNWLILLGIVFLVSIPFWPFWGDQGAGGRGGLGALDRAGAWESTFPRLRSDLLVEKPEKFDGALRNLFTFSEARRGGGGDEEDDDEAVEVNTARQAPELTREQRAEERRAARAKQQLRDYEYLGFVERGGERIAAFLCRGEYYYGRNGQTVNEAFEIRGIEQDTVKIYVLSGEFEQQLKLQKPKGDARDEGEKK